MRKPSQGWWGILVFILIAVPALAADAPEWLESANRNAKVSVGGEFAMDYIRRDASAGLGSSLHTSEMRLSNSNLRLRVNAYQGVTACFKLDFSQPPNNGNDGDFLLEEAKLVIDAVGGGDWKFIFGKGEAPYGQDRALGILQSYHHRANAVDSSEGPSHIVNTEGTLARWRPGEVDRVAMAGAGYTFSQNLYAEAAVFQGAEHSPVAPENDMGTSFSARIWWDPFETLTLQASAMRLSMKPEEPIVSGNIRSGAWAVSVGFDWHMRKWTVFGEYEHGWNWDHLKDSSSDTFQLGAAYALNHAWRLGAMGEWMRIRSPETGQQDDFRKVAANIRYTLDNGVFFLLEYGHEWYLGKRSMQPDDRRDGDFLGFRTGFSF